MTAPTPAKTATRLTSPATAGPKATPAIPAAELGVVDAEAPDPADWPEEPADPEAEPDIRDEPDMVDMEAEPDMDMEEPEAMLDPEAPAMVAMVPETPRDSRAIPLPTEV
jgi:hypothetical protein